ncbi:MAG: hypothetical protein KAI66_18445, partial [Lentisphaeria bacterium]|nr:hypothetical protein [Lentisphaeria bacterium]
AIPQRCGAHTSFTGGCHFLRVDEIRMDRLRVLGGPDMGAAGGERVALAALWRSGQRNPLASGKLA